MLNNDYLFGDEKRIEIIHSLISRLDINSTQRFLNPLGHISKVADEILQTFDIKTSNQDTTLKQSFSEYLIPQNTLLSYNLQNPLSFHDNFVPSPAFLPSGYFNLLHLKNNRDPHFNIKLNLFENKYNVPSFLSGNISGIIQIQPNINLPQILSSITEFTLTRWHYYRY